MKDDQWEEATWINDVINPHFSISIKGKEERERLIFCISLAGSSSIFSASSVVLQGKGVLEFGFSDFFLSFMHLS